MHARHGAGQHEGTPDALPPRVRPGTPEDEEEGEGNRAGNGSDDNGAGDKGRDIIAAIVADGGVAQVVHPANGTSGERTRGAHAPPADLVAARGGAGHDEEGGEQHDDRDKEGGHSDADRVRNLEFRLTVQQSRCAVANIVLENRQAASEETALRKTGAILGLVPCTKWRRPPSLLRRQRGGGW